MGLRNVRNMRTLMVMDSAVLSSNLETQMNINPKWIEYNNTYNEGGEGYNPYPKFIAVAPRPSAATRMIAGKARTHADALKFARNCLSGAQRETFLAEVAAKFGA